MKLLPIRKIQAIALFALIMALLSFGISESATTTGTANDSVTAGVSSGIYLTDGTNNKFISYSLGRNAVKIDLMSNDTTAKLGEIIIPGKIIDVTTGIPTNATPHNSTGFFVSGNFNSVAISNTTVAVSNTTGTTLSGFVFMSPFYPNLNGTVINLSVYVSTANGYYRMAVYNDSGGLPYGLVIESQNSTLLPGWSVTSVNVSSPLDTTKQYWVGLQISSNSAVVLRQNGGGVMQYYSKAYGAFDTTLPATLFNSAPFVQRITTQGSSVAWHWVAI